MDVTLGGNNAAAGNQVVDQVGSRCQKLFQDFLEQWQDQDRVPGSSQGDQGDDNLKYLRLARELAKPARNTLTVSMRDVEQFNANLATLIQDDFYRIYPFLCSALKNFVHDRTDNTQVIMSLRCKLLFLIA